MNVTLLNDFLQSLLLSHMLLLILTYALSIIAKLPCCDRLLLKLEHVTSSNVHFRGVIIGAGLWRIKRFIGLRCDVQVEIVRHKD